MNTDDPASDFLRRLDGREIDRCFLEEFRKLSPHHRAKVCEALGKKSEKFRHQIEESE